MNEDQSTFKCLRRRSGGATMPALWRRFVQIGMVVVAFSLVTFSSDASKAEVDDELADELRTHFKHLDTELPDIQFAKFLTLGHIGDDAAMETLNEATTSDATGRQLAARFGQVVAGKDGAKESLVSVMLKTSDLYELLRTRATLLDDDLEVEVVRTLLGEVEPVQRRDVYRYLSEQKGPLYDLLFEKFRSEEKRSEVMTALRNSLAPHGLERLAELQKNSSEKLAQAAQNLVVEASKIPGRQAEMRPLLEEGLNSPHKQVVVDAAERLLELNDRAGVSKLISLFFDSEGTAFRIKLADLMLKHGVSPETKRLRKLHTSLTSKLESAGGTTGPDIDVESVQALADQTFRLLVASGDSDAFDQAVKWFRSTEFDRRLVAVSAFGYADNNASRAVELLSGALFEGRVDMRLSAAEAFRTLESSEGIPALKRAVDQERAQKVKIEAIRALGAIGSDKALEILRLNTGVRQPALKKAVIRAIRDVGSSDGATALRIFQSARNLEVQWQAYVASLALNPDSAREKLVDKLRNPVDGFMEDLMTVPSDTFTAIIPTMLRHPSRQVHMAAVSTIRRLGSKGMEFARSAWQDNDVPNSVRREALMMVSEYRTDADMERLATYAEQNEQGRLTPQVLWTLSEYRSDELKSTFRAFLPDIDAQTKADEKGDKEEKESGEKEKSEKPSYDAPILSGISAYGLASLN